MLKVDHLDWGQSLEDLYQLGLQSAHRRTRERFLALHAIASGLENATSWAAGFGRNDETVLDWVHRYNQHGPQALIYRRTGGSLPLFAPSKGLKSKLVSMSPRLQMLA